jgi:hypothetical protein
MENFITTSTVMIRRECFEKSGYFDEKITYSEDYKMWLNISKFFQIEYIDLPLVKYRYHEGSLSENRVRINTSSYNVVKEFWRENGKYRMERESLYRLSLANQLKNLGSAYYNCGKTRDSLKILANGMKLNPFSREIYKIAAKAIIRQVVWRLGKRKAI